MTRTRMTYQDESERLIAEQAVLAYRAVREAADGAAHGHGWEAMEDAAVAGCRQQTRRMLAQAARSRIEAQKGGADANGAAGRPRSSVGVTRR